MASLVPPGGGASGSAATKVLVRLGIGTFKIKLHVLGLVYSSLQHCKQLELERWFPLAYPYQSYPAQGQPPRQPPNYQLLAEGADSVFKSFLVSLIIGIIVVAALVIVTLGAVSAIGVANYYEAESLFYSLAATILGVELLALVGSLISFYFLYRGMKLLRLYNALRYGVGYTGVKLVIAAILLAILGLIIIIAGLASAGAAAPATLSPSGVAGALLAGLAVAGIGAIVGFVGVILVFIALWRLGDEPGGGTIKAGVIIWLIGVIIEVIAGLAGSTASGIGGLLVLIGAVLVMIGARSVREHARRLAASQPPPGTTGYAPPYTPP